MIEKDNYRMLDDEESKQYKFEFCELCEFYESCELVGEYEQYKESHNQCPKPQASEPNKKNRLVLNGTAVTLDENEISQDSGSVIYGKAVPLDDEGNEITEPNSVPEVPYYPTGAAELDTNVLSYSQEKQRKQGKGCIMGWGNVIQIECGRQRVTEGIGDHYKIETDFEGNIKEGTTDKWEPLQPVFISAQTGQGKNYFIEETLIPYVEGLNYDNVTEQRVLILSNRLALKQQIKNRLDENEDGEDEIYPYKEFADVMTYQSLLRHEQYLKKKQKKAESRYIFVICDEAHFFTSDAMFNPHTQKILSAIVQLFQDAVRVYMSATPYDCLEYIIKYEDDYQRLCNLYGGMMVLYHFKRDYSYLDAKVYSSIDELYNEIVESVNRRKEKWLIFIDDKEKCKTVKEHLEKFAKDKECPLIIGDAESDKRVEKVFAVDANSKRNKTYQEIVKNEKLNKDTYVLISTSVLDNGVNLTDIKNIVVSDMSKVKCLQMVGRARVKDAEDRKTLYIKRFRVEDINKQISSLKKMRYAYHKYELAYGELRNPLQSRGYSEYQFLNEFYNEEDTKWKDAKHWFGRSADKTTKLYLNEIAKSLVDDKLTSRYKRIYDEMVEESELQGQSGIGHTGQKYLEHQLSWFGKKYCIDDDITYADKEKAKKEFLAFLESYAESGEEIDGTEKMEAFQAEFTKLHDAVFPRADKNLDRFYKHDKMNKQLKAHNIGYKIGGKPQIGPWIVIRDDK